MVRTVPLSRTKRQELVRLMHRVMKISTRAKLIGAELLGPEESKTIGTFANSSEELVKNLKRKLGQEIVDEQEANTNLDD